MYGSESWTIRKEILKRLEAAEIWFLRRMLSISWLDRMSNETVLRKADTRRELIKNHNCETN